MAGSPGTSLGRPSTLSPEYRGIKRIQQACLNCRRKKAKCSGEKPACGFCKRLGQDCQYWVRDKGNSNDEQDQVGAAPLKKTAPQNEELSNRVGVIESKLDQLISTLNACTPEFPSHGDGSLPRPASVLTAQSYPHTQNSLANHLTPASNSKNVKFSVLPPPEVLATLIDVYFSRCHNQPYSFFHEQNFRTRLADGKIPDYLLFAVIATSLRFSTNPYFQGELQEAAASYARESWSQIVSAWFATESDPNLHICQAITVLSILDFTAGRKHPAWLKIGLSIRIAQDLRMMMEPDPALSFVDQEEQRRVFWSIYVLDKLCSCGRARPASIIDAHCHVQLPCGESNFRDGRWENTPSLSEALTPEKHTELGDLALVVLTACIIGKCAQHSIHSHGPDSSHIPPWDSKSDFAAIYSKLLQLETQYDMGSRINNRLANCIRHGVLDMPIAGPLVYSHALFHMSQCLLHHPFLLSNQSRTGAKPPVSFLNRAMQTSRENANSIFALIQDAKNAGYPIYFSFMGYVVSVAGSINMLYLQDEDAGVCGQALISFQSGMEYLEELAKYWKCGARMVANLHRLSTCAIAYKSIATMPSNIEAMDKDVLQAIWGAVDYNSMCEAMDSETHAMTRSAQSPRWNTEPAQNPHSPNRNNSPLLVDPGNFNAPMFGDIAALNSFFVNSPLNFGG